MHSDLFFLAYNDFLDIIVQIFFTMTDLILLADQTLHADASDLVFTSYVEVSSTAVQLDMVCMF